MDSIENKDTIRSTDTIVLGKLVTITEQEEAIDKVKAQHYLNTRYSNQRSLTKAVIDRLVQAMNSGEFIESLGGSIVISDTGQLLDGQHRLTAVTHTDKTIRFNVKRGVPEDAFVYLDQNRTRSLKDTFSTAGIRNPRAVAAAANFLYRLVEGSRANPRNEVALRMIKDHKRFIDSVSFAVSMAAATHVPVSVGAVMHFIYTPEYAAEYDEVFSLLKYGDRDIMSRHHHPIVKLQKKLKEAWTQHRGLADYTPLTPSLGYTTHHLMLSWIHQALTAYIIEGKRGLIWRPDTELEAIIAGITSMARYKVHLRHDYKQ
tara:strand:- start:81 stop:1028 length:948 start_codon:yes stop_codon:yes gene_type:complete